MKLVVIIACMDCPLCKERDTFFYCNHEQYKNLSDCDTTLALDCKALNRFYMPDWCPLVDDSMIITAIRKKIP